MVPVIVVAILGTLLGIAIIAWLAVLIDSRDGERSYKKAKQEWIQRHDREVNEVVRLRSALSNLAFLLPTQNKILSDGYSCSGGGWDIELIDELTNRKNSESSDKYYNKIMKKLEAL